MHSVHPSPFLLGTEGGGGGMNLLPKVQTGGGGALQNLYFLGEGFQILHKKIKFNNKKVYKQKCFPLL